MGLVLLGKVLDVLDALQDFLIIGGKLSLAHKIVHGNIEDLGDLQDDIDGGSVGIALIVADHHTGGTDLLGEILL